MPYVTGGMGPDWIEAVHAVADAGADAVEIGIPFSDPMIDGPIVQEASLRALHRGTTPTSVLDALAHSDLAVPLCVMTYYNIVFRAGLRRFARSLADAGVAGAIIPDLPLEECGEWCAEADAAGVATVLLVAPSTPLARADAICERSRGFVYGVGVMGVTGERARAGELGDRCRQDGSHRLGPPRVHRHRGVDTAAGRAGLCRCGRSRGGIGDRPQAARRTRPRGSRRVRGVATRRHRRGDALRSSTTEEPSAEARRPGQRDPRQSVPVAERQQHRDAQRNEHASDDEHPDQARPGPGEGQRCRSAGRGGTR